MNSFSLSNACARWNVRKVIVFLVKLDFGNNLTVILYEMAEIFRAKFYSFTELYFFLKVLNSLGTLIAEPKPFC